MDRETRFAVFRMLNEYAMMQGLDLRDKHKTCITDDIWDFGFYYENEAVNPWFSFNWLNITDSQFTIVYQVIRVFEENSCITNSLKYKHNLKKNADDGNDYTIQKEKTTMMNYTLLELLKEEQSVVMHIEKMKQEEQEVNNDLQTFHCGVGDEDYVPTVESRKLLTMLERRQRIVMAELQALDQELAMVRNKIKEYIQCTLGLQTM